MQAEGPTGASQRVFFRQLHERFDLACGATEKIVGDYAIANRPVRLEFAGLALQQLYAPALQHLATEFSGPPELYVRLWDTTSTGSLAPPPPWGRSAFGTRHEIRQSQDSGILACFDVEHGLLSVFETSTREGFFWSRDIALVPAWERAAPLRAILSWWARTFGGQLLHGASVGIDGDGVLITARGGSGKSTTALACLDAGFEYLGDDYVMFVSDETDGPFIHSLYSTAKVHRDGIARSLRSIAFQDRLHDLSGDKVVLYLRNTHLTQLRRQLRFKAILIPRISQQIQSSVRSVSPATALSAMAPTTLFQLPAAGSAEFASLRRIAQLCPAYELDLGTDLHGVTECLAELVAGSSEK